MGNCVGRRHAADFDGYIPGFRAVVDLGQKVAVDVDHGIVFTSKKSMCNTTIRTHPPARHRRSSAACLSRPVLLDSAPLGRAPFGSAQDRQGPATTPAHPTQRSSRTVSFVDVVNYDTAARRARLRVPAFSCTLQNTP